jgi:pimeloyl-ACP methyl ester carboxylesterase
LFLLFYAPAFKATSQISISTRKDTLIVVGGHKLHFVITKAGEATILLEAGGGANASQWKEVQQEIAKQVNVTVISYDRAGYGQSELIDTPYDLKEEVKDLHTCLDALGVGKIILVSHSYGAFLSQGYQFLYPENVEGIILADPNNIRFVDSIGFKILMTIPFDTTKPLSISQRADVRQTIAFKRTIETLRGMPFSKKIPITVISAGKDWWPLPKWNRWWKDSHQVFVGESKNRKLITAERSAHNIPKESPGVIVDAIMEMLK